MFATEHLLILLSVTKTLLKSGQPLFSKHEVNNVYQCTPRMAIRLR